MLSKLFSKEYFRERALMVLTLMAIVSMAVTLFRVVTTVRPFSYKILTSYTQYGPDTFESAEWYTLYEFAAFALITTLGAIFISARLFRVDKPLSYTVIILQHVVLVFLFIVSNALLIASGVAS